MTLTPFCGRCHTCGHDHDAEDVRLRDLMDICDAAGIEALRNDLIACRGSVKTDYNFYSRAADTVQHTGSTKPEGYYEREAQRLHELLDRIDAVVALRDGAERRR